MKKLALLFASTAMLSGCAAQAGEVDRAEVEQIVRAYLLENPEILREMSIALQDKEREEEIALTAEALKDLAPRISGDSRDIAIGPENAKVTLVEFFDYNCGYCKQSTEWLRGVIDEHGDDVRVVFKEVPVLDRGRDGSSRNAARAALAAARQGKYPTLHFSLMNERALTPERVEALVEAAGLDMDKFRTDIKDPALDVHINQNLQLAREIPAMTGTPFFVINDQYVSGANTELLERVLNEELAG